jgi:hypothetical protein
VQPAGGGPAIYPGGGNFTLSGAEDGQGDAQTITVSYYITPPYYSWLAAPNGTYVVELVSNPPTDLAGNTAAIGAVGSFTVTTSKGSTTTTAVALAVSAVFGQSVTYLAIVSANSSGLGLPSGSVTFLDGSTTLGTAGISYGVGLSSDIAVFTTSGLSVGSHAITAVYSGDTNLLSSTSATLLQSVSPDSTTTTVLSSIDPSVSGQSIVLFAIESPAAPGSGTPTGTVTFSEGTATLGTATLRSGIASFLTSVLAVGLDPITAAYGGDANFKSSTSGALTQTVNRADSTTLVFNPVNPSVFGQEVVFTALVSAVAPGSGTPSGTATFKDGSGTMGTAALTFGRATITRYGLSAGHHSITVNYSGDAKFNDSVSVTLTQTVNPENTITLVASSANPSVMGQAVMFTALVYPLPQGSGTPTGSVMFLEGMTTLGTATLKANANGTGSMATFSISTLAVGSQVITAAYSGSGNSKASSGTLTQTVTAAVTMTPQLVSAAEQPVGPSVSFVGGQGKIKSWQEFARSLEPNPAVSIGGRILVGADEGSLVKFLGVADRTPLALGRENLAALDDLFALGLTCSRWV